LKGLSICPERSELVPTLRNKNNWGQININFQSKETKGKGAERFLVLQYEEAPLPFVSFD
jgi:hypothetical protein